MLPPCFRPRASLRAVLWVELYGEGDWEKASKTVAMATREALNDDRKVFDTRNYTALIALYYDLQHYEGYELQRQRAMERKKAEG